MIDPSKLNKFSRGVYDELSAKFPELASRAVLEVNPGVTAGSLLIQFAPADARPESIFWVSTDKEEVTVGFDRYHSHFGWPAESSDWQMNALSFIDALIAEKIVVEIWEKAGEWAGSSVLEADQKPDLSEIQRDHVVFVRSWSGRLDREYTQEAG